jgi:5-(carboxyamino)imidazole ribonucleotide mutase
MIMAKFEVGIDWKQPPIDLVMGSDSDVLIVEDTVDLLDEFGVPHEPWVISAHRTPEELDEYTRSIRIRESDLVIVAFAGMAAALGGDTAARVPQAVIGVPLLNSKDNMNASTAAQQMLPPGNGLTIVGPDQGVNAGLAALRALGTSHPEVRTQLLAYQEHNRAGVVAKNQKMKEVGVKGYATEKRNAK